MAPSGVPSDVLRNSAARTRVDCSFVEEGQPALHPENKLTIESYKSK